MIYINYPIYIRDKENFNIALGCIVPKSKWYKIVFHINGLDAEYQSILDKADIVFYRHENIVAGAWNAAVDMAKHGDLVWILNQDIKVIEPNSLIQYLPMKKEEVLTHRYDANSFSCFGAFKETFEYVGRFDENFKPAYFEDNDYLYRMKLKNVRLFALSSTQLGMEVEHHGSSVIKHNAKMKASNNMTFRANQRYYVKKWGGMPNYERFKTPFNE